MYIKEKVRNTFIRYKNTAKSNAKANNTVKFLPFEKSYANDMQMNREISNIAESIVLDIFNNEKFKKYDTTAFKRDEITTIEIAGNDLAKALVVQVKIDPIKSEQNAFKESYYHDFVVIYNETKANKYITNNLHNVLKKKLIDKLTEHNKLVAGLHYKSSEAPKTKYEKLQRVIDYISDIPEYSPTSVSFRNKQRGGFDRGQKIVLRVPKELGTGPVHLSYKKDGGFKSFGIRFSDIEPIKDSSGLSTIYNMYIVEDEKGVFDKNSIYVNYGKLDTNYKDKVKIDFNLIFEKFSKTTEKARKVINDNLIKTNIYGKQDFFSENGFAKDDLISLYVSFRGEFLKEEGILKNHTMPFSVKNVEFYFKDSLNEVLNKNVNFSILRDKEEELDFLR